MGKVLSCMALAAALFVVLPSCTKNAGPGRHASPDSTLINPVGPASACQVIAIVDSLVPAMHFDYFYDSQGRVDSVRAHSAQSGTTVKTFQRNGDNVIMVSNYNGVSILDSITINSDGLITRDLTRNDTPIVLANFTYDGIGIQRVVTQASDGTLTTDFAWVNGDIGSLTNTYMGPPVTTTFTYNSQPSTTGDYWWLVNRMAYGAPYVVVAHQATSLTQGGETITFTYGYDSDGKITSLTYGGLRTEVVTYQYSCH